MADLERLLEVQGHDTTVDQLTHRRANLPIREGLARARQALSDAEATLRRAEGARKQADTEREKLESDVADVDRRIQEIEGRMFGGSVTSPRDLESMATEVSHLKERLSGLEEEALAAMDGAESAVAGVEAAQTAVQDLAAEVSRLEVELGVAEAEVDQLIDQERAPREAAAAGLPSELIATYEKIRAKLGGVGAARLVGDSCSGCHLSLPSGELERLRRAPPEAVCFCDNCQRILVR